MIKPLKSERSGNIKDYNLLLMNYIRGILGVSYKRQLRNYLKKVLHACRNGRQRKQRHIFWDANYMTCL